jgi:hypothetical protein
MITTLLFFSKLEENSLPSAPQVNGEKVTLRITLDELLAHSFF